MEFVIVLARRRRVMAQRAQHQAALSESPMSPERHCHHDRHPTSSKTFFARTFGDICRPRNDLQVLFSLSSVSGKKGAQTQTSGSRYLPVGWGSCQKFSTKPRNNKLFGGISMPEKFEKYIYIIFCPLEPCRIQEARNLGRSISAPASRKVASQ